jgi:hypothetical protein
MTAVCVSANFSGRVYSKVAVGSAVVFRLQGVDDAAVGVQPLLNFCLRLRERTLSSHCLLLK